MLLASAPATTLARDRSDTAAAPTGRIRKEFVMRILYLAALSIALLAASPAAAGRSGGATLEFNPNAAPAWSWANA